MAETLWFTLVSPAKFQDSTLCSGMTASLHILSTSLIFVLFDTYQKNNMVSPISLRLVLLIFAILLQLSSWHLYCSTETVHWLFTELLRPFIIFVSSLKCTMSFVKVICGFFFQIQEWILLLNLHEVTECGNICVIFLV